jgi:hypothetical protein
MLIDHMVRRFNSQTRAVKKGSGVNGPKLVLGRTEAEKFINT